MIFGTPREIKVNFFKKKKLLKTYVYFCEVKFSPSKRNAIEKIDVIFFKCSIKLSFYFKIKFRRFLNFFGTNVTYHSYSNI